VKPAMTNTEQEIKEIVDRETTAWDTKNVDLLMTVWHQDMVWPWPPHAKAHDPAEWVLELGRFNYQRWKTGWQKLFDTHELVYNKRNLVKITISKEGDGALAVVDVDTLWRDQNGNVFHWLGRAGKVYTKVNGEWKLIMYTDLLEY